jgi:hypothetical protein
MTKRLPTSPNPELQALIEKVKGHYRALQDREVLWVVESAREATIEDIRKARAEILELQHFPEIALYPGHRAEEPMKDRLEESLRSLHKRLEFLDALHQLLDHQTMLDSLAGIAEFFKQK